MATAEGEKANRGEARGFASLCSLASEVDLTPPSSPEPRPNAANEPMQPGPQATRSPENAAPSAAPSRARKLLGAAGAVGVLWLGGYFYAMLSQTSLGQAPATPPPLRGTNTSAVTPPPGTAGQPQPGPAPRPSVTQAPTPKTKSPATPSAGTTDWSQYELVPTQPTAQAPPRATGRPVATPSERPTDWSKFELVPTKPSAQVLSPKTTNPGATAPAAPAQPPVLARPQVPASPPNGYEVFTGELDPVSRPWGSEVMPRVGENLVFPITHIRYCLAEEIRLEAAKSAAKGYTASGVDRFNAMVTDYNSRCASFRYRGNALESARQDVEPYRRALQAEGRRRFTPRTSGASSSQGTSR